MISAGALRQQLDDELYYGPTDNAHTVCEWTNAMLSQPYLRKQLGDYATVLKDRLDLLKLKLEKE